ncbi:Ca-activated chloride channel family protein [Geothermobacter ehrlichii]|uniref:Ca-activated chloride channel family protein n=1 Tax=Geothermobacter ehrlichii TaxID=213224 RepID=A0A5D3WJQ4_9BACT|nr:VWA domain-containing protein [Geothermobacter ehrlichii]TYO98277.1 Ca-activated chloride channel family protein [Geothermobacter ehrlichii]
MTAAIVLACLLILWREASLRRLPSGHPLAAGQYRRLAYDLCALLVLLLLLYPTGLSPERTTQSRPLNLAVAIDVSWSMGADAGGISRLDRVRQDLALLLQELPGAKVALVPFAGAPVLQSPLTADHQALRLLLDGLRPGQVAAPGSAPEEAVLFARRLLEECDGEKAVLLYSDGERTLPTPPPVIGRGIAVYTLLPADDRPQQVPGRTFHGRPALSRPDRQRMQAIAETGGGSWLRIAPSEPTIDQLPFLHRQKAATTPTAFRPWLWAALFLLVARHLFIARPAATLLTAGLLLALLPLGCDRSRTANTPEALFSRAMKGSVDEETVNLFRQAAAGVTGEKRAVALHNACSDALNLQHPRLAVELCEQALLSAPGRQASITNLSLALRLLRQSPAGGSENRAGKQRSEKEGMRPEQARQLLQSIEVRAGELAPAGDGENLEITVEKDW